MSDFIRYVKKIAVASVEAQKPCTVMFGKVTNLKPLKIFVEQKLTLNESQLILSRSVKDYETDISGGYLEGKQKITVHNGLAVGDGVFLLRMHGGKKFIVVDRINVTV